MKKIVLTMVIAAIVLLSQIANAQVGLNILRNKLENKADKAIEEAIDKKAGSSTSDNTDTKSGKTKVRNKSGAGLVTTPPDVKQNLEEAEKTYKAGSYGEARYAIQQAMLGVEMEIGHKILKSMPEKIESLKSDASTEKVTSSGWGWNGLTIQRQYSNGDDKELTVTVANNAVMMGALNAYLANGSMAQTSSGEQNWKQTKVKGHRAVIEYDEDSGYKLSVPLGQSSMVIYEGINFKNEQELVSAAGTLDLDGIKKMLGEQ